MEKVYKYDLSSDATLESLQNTKPYILRNKINNGEKLSADEKLYIAQACKDCTFSNKGFSYMGWYFDFSDVMRAFLICQQWHWYEVWAFNKTQLRKLVYGKIDKITQE